MGTKKLTIAMNGITGRMGYRQHLVRSILPLREEGLELPDGTRIEVEPILVGRRPDAVAEIAERHGWSAGRPTWTRSWPTTAWTSTSTPS